MSYSQVIFVEKVLSSHFAYSLRSSIRSIIYCVKEMSYYYRSPLKKTKGNISWLSSSWILLQLWSIFPESTHSLYIHKNLFLYVFQTKGSFHIVFHMTIYGYSLLWRMFVKIKSSVSSPERRFPSLNNKKWSVSIELLILSYKVESKKE